MSKHQEIFRRLLDETAALLAAPESAGIAIPDDELHREIIVPLLPAMLGDNSIRGHWIEQAATGFPARLVRHLDGGEPAPRWMTADFEIHVTASYSASADARALADTLLSEESLRDLTAALMNQFLDALWPKLVPATTPAPAPAPTPEPEMPKAAVEVSSVETPSPEIAPPVEIAVAVGIPPAGLQDAAEPPSRVLVRVLCRKISAPAFRRGFAANSAPRGASAAITARRILQAATCKCSRRRSGTRTKPSAPRG